MAVANFFKLPPEEQEKIWAEIFGLPCQEKGTRPMGIIREDDDNPLQSSFDPSSLRYPKESRLSLERRLIEANRISRMTVDDGVALTSMAHPELNPSSLERVEIELPAPPPWRPNAKAIHYFDQIAIGELAQFIMDTARMYAVDKDGIGMRAAANPERIQALALRVLGQALEQPVAMLPEPPSPYSNRPAPSSDLTAASFDQAARVMLDAQCLASIPEFLRSGRPVPEPPPSLAKVAQQSRPQPFKRVS